MAAVPPPSHEVTGVILAGGLGRRLGGAKASRLLAGRPLLTHVVDRLRPQFAAGRLMLNINDDATDLAGYALPVLPDSISGRPGPLAGILAALLAAPPSTAWLVSAPTDTPFLPLDLVQGLVRLQRETGAEIVLAQSDAGLCQVCGLWSVAIAAKLAHSLAIGQNKVLDFVERHQAGRQWFPPQLIGRATADPFFNINTPNDLATAERLFEN